MTTSGKPQGRPTNDLRTQAEQRVPRTTTDVSGLSAAQIERLVYELEVHQEELEIQNEELRRVQQELQQSRDRYVELYDFAPVGYLTLDAEGCLVEANLTAAAMLGVERSKLIGTRLAPYCDQGSKADLHSYLDQLLTSGKRQVREMNFTGPATFCAQLESSCDAGGDGCVRRYHVVMTDVTARRAAEQALRVRDRAFVAAANGVVITDPAQPDNPIIDCNPAFERMTGYTREEIIGRDCRFLQADDRDQPQRQEIRKAINEGRSVTSVLRNYRKDGTLFWNEVHIAPVRDEHGVLTHFVAIQNDVTQRKLVEQQDVRRRIIEERLGRLNARERAVYELLLRGKSNKAIAVELDVGLRTVERRRHVILEKLQVGSLAELLHQFADIQNMGDALRCLSGDS